MRHCSPPATPVRMAVLVLACAAPAFALQVDRRLMEKEAIQKHIDRQVPARGRPVSVESSVSTMTVQPGPDDQVRVSADLRFWSSDTAWMASAGDEFDVRVTESSGEIAVRVELPKRRGRPLERGASVNYSVELAITVPPSTPLRLTNSFGDVTISEVGGPAQVNNSSGGISVVRGSGLVSLEGSFGGITATDIAGELRAAITSGGITAARIGGPAALTSSFGDVQVDDVAGALTVTTTSGDVAATDARSGARLSTSFGQVTADRIQGDLIIDVKSGGARATNVTGSLQATGSFGDIVAEHVQGPADISIQSGGVTATDIGGDLAARCSFGTVRARRLGGRLTVAAATTSVDADTIGGAVDVQTTFGGVRLSGVRGEVRVTNQSGSVTVRGLSGAALETRHRIETSFGDIDVSWPETAGLAFHLESSFGSADSAFPGRSREVASRRIVEGTHGSGRAAMSLVTQSGGVHLKKD